jgi:osmotically-inducible protein OsmY
MNAHTTETLVGPSALLAEAERLETLVQSRLHGRVRNFRVAVRGGGVILTGQSRTYYAKQLAQQAVLEASALPILANEIHVS